MLNKKQIEDNLQKEYPSIKHKRIVKQAIKEVIKEYENE